MLGLIKESCRNTQGKRHHGDSGCSTEHPHFISGQSGSRELPQKPEQPRWGPKRQLHTEQDVLSILLAPMNSMRKAVPGIPRISEGGEGRLKLLLTEVSINSLLRVIFFFFAFQNIPYEALLEA